MDNDTKTTSATVALLNAVEEYHVVKNGENAVEANNAFDALMEVFNDVRELGHA